MAQYLPFWPKAAVLCNITGGNALDIFTKALPTNGFTEVVAQLECDATIAGSNTPVIDVTSQISNDGGNWEDSTGFTQLSQTPANYPVKEVVKLTTIAAFMRFKITLNCASASDVGATLMISGAGRS